ncbi:PREDICTED: LOW QUALITY PROTEIN: ATP-binding cassette sub-family D member 3 [Amphimedon queenslandica]|uniref:ABC transmembrane type-1 domain-containing protein n=1 Tax=Amphimedon queenslandica TaxID=400682 RepID=A0AAN0J4E9_AMPQE|nr:PREDICTED: LOW QUALITY PROTEIN: ATP-binding cassette sub-family D member 3 [Amphimedon queenslandica]|eukprot:XP_019851626.1 PREDICTED: LOW QUALITY PROTEIN: ATP-binding cassette sub-family D member 3 [Amphimedon queenslandica]
MPAVASKLASNPRAVVALATTIAGLGLYVSVRRKIASRRKDEEAYIAATQDKVGDKRKGDRAAVDWEFIKRIVRLFRILVPRVLCPETGYLIMVAIMLVLRTYADVWMIQNGTSVEGSIIGRNFEAFKKYVLSFLYAMPFISLVNITLKYSLQELELRFRSRLSLHLYRQYMKGFTFYKCPNLDNRIANADQLLTQVISKPILDICLYFYQLSSSIGAQGPLVMLLYLAFAGLFLTRLRAPVGRMTVKEQQLEGTLRYVNSRVITNSEEISFYQGNNRERLTIEETFKHLVKHLRSVIHFRFAMGFIDNLTAKYFATVVGYMVVSRPFLDLSHPRHLSSTHHQIMLDYYRSGRMLVRMSEAIGRLVLAGRDMARLSGFTARIHQLTTVLRDLHKGQYVRTMVNTSDSGNGTNGETMENRENTSIEGPPLVPGSGEIIEVDNLIKFEHVPLVTPNGDVLVRDMNFEVHSGMNVLVCGPNGCGKSSLFRILGEVSIIHPPFCLLWPHSLRKVDVCGRVVAKAGFRIFVLRPEVPYNTMINARLEQSSIFAFAHCVIQHFRSQRKYSEPT